MNESTNSSGMMSWQSVAGIVAATFAGCAAVISWLDARAKRMLSEATGDLKERVEKLEARVLLLESDKSTARSSINRAMIKVAMGAPADAILKDLEEADVALH